MFLGLVVGTLLGPSVGLVEPERGLLIGNWLAFPGLLVLMGVYMLILRFLVVAMAVGASIGSPATPGVGIVILAMVLQTVGVPPAGIALIMGVDRILDMCRTAINVTGDLLTCRIMERLAPDQAPRGEP